MIRRVLASTFVALVFAGVCFASDLAGRWEGKVPGPNGQEMQLAFTFKVDGDKLTGTVDSPMGQSPIEDGKVNGSEVTFTVQTPGEAITHDGKLSGDTIDMKVHGPWGDSEFNLKHPAPK